MPMGKTPNRSKNTWISFLPHTKFKGKNIPIKIDVIWFNQMQQNLHCKPFPMEKFTNIGGL